MKFLEDKLLSMYDPKWVIINVLGIGLILFRNGITSSVQRCRLHVIESGRSKFNTKMSTPENCSENPSKTLVSLENPIH